MAREKESTEGKKPEPPPEVLLVARHIAGLLDALVEYRAAQKSTEKEIAPAEESKPKQSSRKPRKRKS